MEEKVGWVENLDEDDVRVGWVGDLKKGVMEHCDEMMGKEEVEVNWVGYLRKNEMLVSWAEDVAEGEEVVQ